MLPYLKMTPQTNQDFEHDPPAKWPPPITAPWSHSSVVYSDHWIWQLLQEQQKQLTLLEEEQLNSSVLSDKPPETEKQTSSLQEEEDTKTSKSVLAKSQSLERCDVSQEDGEKSVSSIRRSKTLPARIKMSPTDPADDKTGG